MIKAQFCKYRNVHNNHRKRIQFIYCKPPYFPAIITGQKPNMSISIHFNLKINFCRKTNLSFGHLKKVNFFCRRRIRSDITVPLQNLRNSKNRSSALSPIPYHPSCHQNHLLYRQYSLKILLIYKCKFSDNFRLVLFR